MDRIEFKDVCHFVVLLLLNVQPCLSACTQPSSEWTGVWYDSGLNDEVTMTYTGGDLKVSGWKIRSYQSTVTAWTCVVEDTSNNYLVFLGDTKINLFSSQQDAYLCVQWKKISTYSYHYQVQASVEPNAYNSRVYVNNVNTALGAASTYCSPTSGPSSTEYIVMVKKGKEESLEYNLPTPLLGNFAYTAEDTGGTTYCSGGSYMDVCTNRTQIQYNMTLCNQKIAFSADGHLYAVYSATSGSEYFLTVLNTDSSPSSGSSTYRFTCIVFKSSGSGVAASFGFGQCLSDRTATTIPTNGYKATLTADVLCPFTSPTSSVPEDSASSAGLIAGIVVALIILIGAAIGAFFVYRMMKKKKREAAVDSHEAATKKLPPPEDTMVESVRSRDAVDIHPTTRNTLTPLTTTRPAAMGNGSAAELHTLPPIYQQS